MKHIYASIFVFLMLSRCRSLFEPVDLGKVFSENPQEVSPEHKEDRDSIKKYLQKSQEEKDTVSPEGIKKSAFVNPSLKIDRETNILSSTSTLIMLSSLLPHSSVVLHGVESASSLLLSSRIQRSAFGHSSAAVKIGSSSFSSLFTSKRQLKTASRDPLRTSLSASGLSSLKSASPSRSSNVILSRSKNAEYTTGLQTISAKQEDRMKNWTTTIGGMAPEKVLIGVRTITVIESIIKEPHSYSQAWKLPQELPVEKSSDKKKTRQSQIKVSSEARSATFSKSKTKARVYKIESKSRKPTISDAYSQTINRSKKTRKHATSTIGYSEKEASREHRKTRDLNRSITGKKDLKSISQSFTAEKSASKKKPSTETTSKKGLLGSKTLLKSESTKERLGSYSTTKRASQVRSKREISSSTISMSKIPDKGSGFKKLSASLFSKYPISSTIATKKGHVLESSAGSTKKVSTYWSSHAATVSHTASITEKRSGAGTSIGIGLKSASKDLLTTSHGAKASIKSISAGEKRKSSTESKEKNTTVSKWDKYKQSVSEKRISSARSYTSLRSQASISLYSTISSDVSKERKQMSAQSSAPSRTIDAKVQKSRSTPKSLGSGFGILKKISEFGGSSDKDAPTDDTTSLQEDTKDQKPKDQQKDASLVKLLRVLSDMPSKGDKSKVFVDGSFKAKDNQKNLDTKFSFEGWVSKSSVKDK